MLVTGIILASAAIATPAIQDLVNLRTVISAAASTIGDPKNPNLGWGIGFGGGNGMGTADLVNNITNTVLRINFQVNTNKTSWLLPDNVTAPATNATTPSLLTPTLPLTTSLAVPSAVPTSLVNATTDLSTPYIDYVSAIPDLSTSLTTMGRAFHREMNAPVNEAIQGLQQALTSLQTTMLQSNLISSQAILRTIRASSSLENAQVAWGRFLNLPGAAENSGNTGSGTGSGGILPGLGKRQVALDGEAGKIMRPPPAAGQYYTHEELWGRERPSTKGKAKRTEARAGSEERGVTDGTENGKIGRPFVV